LYHSQKAVGDGQQPPVHKGEGGYADWVIVALHGIQEYLGHQYCRLMNVLGEIPGIVTKFDGIVTKFDLTVGELPDITTVCTHEQDLEMRIWRVLLRLSARL
jgi:hypothetical protein